MRLMSIVKSFLGAGLSFLPTERQRRVNRLQNQFNLLYGFFFSVQFLASCALGGYLLIFEPQNFYPALLVYAVPPLVSLAYLYLLFRRKQASAGILQRDLEYHLFIVTIVSAMSLFLGNASSFWIFYLPHFVNPFMIFNISRRQAFAFGLTTGFFMVPVLWYSSAHGPLLPLPGHIINLVSWLIISLFSGLTLALGAAAWWRLSLTRRLINLWAFASEFGTHLFDSEIDRKYRRIQNRVILIFAGLMVFLIGAMLIILLDIRVHTTEPLLGYVLHYGIPATTELLVLIACLAYNHRHGSVAASVFAWISGLIHIGYLGISLQPSVKFYLFNLAILPMPYIAFSGLQRRNRIIAFVLSLSLVTIIMSSLWFLRNQLPLKPIPELISLQVIKYLIPLSLLLTYIVYFQYVWRLNAQTEDMLETEKDKSDRLLLNILPAHVAEQLKLSGRSEPIFFRSATVMFSDFVGFTGIAETMSPEELVGELDRCFSYFDSVCEKYKLEKLKTIGDAYMAAGGVPIPNNTHAIDCCLAALEVRAFMAQMREIKEAQSLPYWQLRLGINTGNLVAGVVGERKFAYDVWGDTVNLASRMESAGMANQINISRGTYDQVRFLFSCAYRGRIRAKNKGELDMFILERLKPRFSVNGEGRVPNADFHQIYDKISRGGKFRAIRQTGRHVEKT
jgi:class 3 adenylate cyclase